MQSKKLDSNPIPDTLETIPGYPKTLKIYRVPCSNNYYMRCWMSGKMVTRTTQVKNKELAKKAAIAFYNELIVKRATGQPLTDGNQFSAAFDGLMIDEQSRVANKDIKQSSLDDLQYAYDQDLLPFFKHDQLKNITYSRLMEFVRKLQERDVSPKTIKNKLLCLSKILTWAVKHNRLDKLPIFPSIEITDNPRSWFDEAQWVQLIQTIMHEIENKTVIRYHPITNELLSLTSFMVDSFLRPQDIKLLKHRDITVFKNNPNTYLRILAKGKVKQQPVVTMKGAVRTYEDHLKWISAPKGCDKPDDYVFFGHLPGREHAQKIMQLQFQYVLDKAGLKTSHDGQERTLYSLRHTAIMNRLLKGDMDVFLLARNCRTSVEMLQRFYGSHLTPEMKVAELQSFKNKADDLDTVD